MTQRPIQEQIIRHIRMEKRTTIMTVAQLFGITIYQARKEITSLKARGCVVYRTSYGWFESEKSFQEWMQETRNEREEERRKWALGKNNLNKKNNTVFDECRSSQYTQRMRLIFNKNN
ncbi:DUF977 family protein [Klebsiella oxytoca]